VGGYGVLFFATGQKKIIKVFQSCLPTLPAYFPFETSFFGNLGIKNKKYTLLVNLLN
jgi:hypothetical protein